VRATTIVVEGKAQVARDRKKAPEVAPADAVAIELLAGGKPAASIERHVRQLEIARLCDVGDAAMIDGDVDAARAAYLDALERAPKHPTICARLAELDAGHADAGARVEAALGWLREAHRGAQTGEDGDAGEGADDGGELARLLLAGALHERAIAEGRGARGKALSVLARAGDVALARGVALVAARAFTKIAALTEPPQTPSELAAAQTDQSDIRLAAKSGSSAAQRPLRRLTDERTEALRAKARAPALDRAIGADPALAAARWMRARDRIVLGDDAGALEDLQHLEALARGREARRRTLITAAEMLSRAGRSSAAIEAFERALRYTPDDRETVAGLGRAMLVAGEATRGMSLLAHAITRPGAIPDDDALAIDLARAIATHTGDLSAAVARLRAVAGTSTRATLARALEGAWCAKIGDAPGATRAFDAAADFAARRATPPADVDDALAVLRDAASEAEQIGDRVSALRYARGASALAPTDRALQDAAAKLARPTPIARVDRVDRVEPSVPAVSLDVPSTDHGSDEEEAERLLARVKADPDDAVAIDRLADLLGKLGRDFELFALLSARYDDADPATRARLAPRQRATLLRMAEGAARAGRASEAELYRDAARALR
jgi:tetratricopeptide (TPR) repeat protein